MNERWIVIPNWHGENGEEGLQHYRDRDPIWIKNYRRLLVNPDYLNLTAPARALLHGLWLLYASSDGAVPEQTSYLSRALALRVSNTQLEALNHAGFIELSASKPLALRYQRASPEREGEREKEKNPPTPLRGTTKTARQPRAAKLRYLPSVEAIWNASTVQEREKRVRVWLEGFTADEVEIAAHIDVLTEKSAAA